MDILHEALVALSDWVEAGCSKHPVFKRQNAICCNIEEYIEYRGYDYQDKGSVPFDPRDAYLKLKNLFTEEGLDRRYPFNEGDEEKFGKELFDLKFWKNPKRLAWLKRHGQRTISDCIPLFSKTPNPEISIIANVYHKNGRRWAIPDVWRYHKRLGAVKVDDNSLLHQIYLYLNAKGVSVEGFKNAL